MPNQEFDTQAAGRNHDPRTARGQTLTGQAYLRDQLTLPLTLPNGAPVFLFEQDGILELRIATKLLCTALAAVSLPGEPTAKDKALYLGGDAPDAYKDDVHQTRITVTPTSLRFTATASDITCETEVGLPEALENVPAGGVAFLVPQTVLMHLFSEANNKHGSDGTSNLGIKRWGSKGYDFIKYDEDVSYLVLTRGESLSLNVAVKKVPVIPSLSSMMVGLNETTVSNRIFPNSLKYLDYISEGASSSNFEHYASFEKERMFANNGSRGVLYHNKMLDGLGFDLSCNKYKILRSVLNNITAPFRLKIAGTRAFLEDDDIKISFPIQKISRSMEFIDKFTEQCADQSFKIPITELIQASRMVDAGVAPQDTIVACFAKRNTEVLFTVEGVSTNTHFSTVSSKNKGDIEFIKENGTEFKIFGGEFIRAVKYLTADMVTVSVLEQTVRFSECSSEHECSFIVTKKMPKAGSIKGRDAVSGVSASEPKSHGSGDQAAIV